MEKNFVRGVNKWATQVCRCPVEKPRNSAAVSHQHQKHTQPYHSTSRFEVKLAVFQLPCWCMCKDSYWPSLRSEQNMLKTEDVLLDLICDPDQKKASILLACWIKCSCLYILTSVVLDETGGKTIQEDCATRQSCSKLIAYGKLMRQILVASSKYVYGPHLLWNLFLRHSSTGGAHLPSCQSQWWCKERHQGDQIRNHFWWDPKHVLRFSSCLWRIGAFENPDPPKVHKCRILQQQKNAGFLVEGWHAYNTIIATLELSSEALHMSVEDFKLNPRHWSTAY